jgi:tol-pal system protein YbgF
MKPQSTLGRLILTAFFVTLWGCDPYSYYPGRAKPAPPPTAAPGESTPAPAPTLVPVTEGKSDVYQQVMELQARVQRLENQVSEMEQRQGYPAAVKPSAAKPPAAKPAAKTAPAPPPAAPAPAAAAAGQDKGFNDGMRLYQAKKYGSAREKFSQYLKAHPQGGKAAESRYYLADSFYQEKKYKEAAVEYNKLVTQHSQSILAPAALMRQALCYHNLQQKQNYQATLKKLVKAYPQSAEAKEAQKWLKQ